MRKRLMAAAAVAPLMLGYQAAYAQNPTLTISSDTSTPVATATAVNGGAGDIALNSGVTFTIKDSTPALTLNSNNNVTQAGTLTSSGVNNATGILVQGPFSGGVFNSGSISLGESFTASDSANSDGIAEAPFASPGSTGRIGIRVTGPLAGTVNNSGSISIQGNNSTGISIENSVSAVVPPAGGSASAPVVAGGSITVTGDRSFGVFTSSAGHIIGVAGGNPGDLYINASITMKGQGSVGVQTNAPIDGALRVYGTISTTGYAITTRETGQVLTNIQKTPADVQQGGSALQIQGNVAGGVFLGAPPPATVASDTTTDADGDQIVDSGEPASSLITYGSAPTLQIGASNAITIGNFYGTSTTQTFNNNYGLIVEGTVTSQGIWDGVSSTAIDIGTYTDGNGTVSHNGVNLTGGIRVSGVISATSFQADATAIHLEPGVTGGGILNQGQITAAVTSAGANTATAIQIDAGSRIGSLINYGAIAAGVTGDQGSASAVIDRGGGISSVTNFGVITTALNPALPGEAVTGKSVALDLSVNTTGVTLIQDQDPNNLTVTPTIVGDVLLSKTGSNSVDLENGSMRGTLDLGSAPGSLTINNNANYTGALQYGGSALKIDVIQGVLQDNSATPVGASSLHVGGSSTLGVALDPAHNTYTQFNVSGAATFDPGAKITASVLSTPNLGGQTFTIVKAGSLSVGSTDSALLTGLPYLFNGGLHADTAANTISVTIVPKTPAQMGFNKAETAAFSSIYAALPHDTNIQTAILGAPNRSTLVANYDQLLPSSSGDVFNTALGMSKAVSRAASDRFDFMGQPSDDEDEGEIVTSGFWASEFYSGLWQNKADNNAYHSAALGVIGGYDFGGTGFTIAAGSSNITVPGQPGDTLNAVSVVEGGFYASPRFGALSIDARVGAGYVNVSNRRQLAATITSGDLSTTTNITRSAKGEWSGFDFSGHLGAGLEWDVSKHLFFEPKVYADVFHMHEGAYTERGGAAGNPQLGVDGYDFAVSARDSTQTNATASLVTGLRFGNLFVISPQLEIGYDKVLTGGPGDTTARFVYGGPSFTVQANKIDGAAMGRLTLRGDGNYVHFSLQAGGEYASDYHSLDAKAVFRLTF